MPNRKTAKIHNWKAFLFSEDHTASNFHDDVGLFQLFRTWRRYFLIFVLGFITVIAVGLGLDNVFNLGNVPMGLGILCMSAMVAVTLLKVVRAQEVSLAYELATCGLIVFATTAAAYSNGILPMVLFSATVVCYYMLLPVRYALGVSLGAFALNSAAMFASVHPFESALYVRVVAEAAMVLPVLHFYVCLTNFLASNYSEVLSARTRFLNTISHELRSPLNGLTGLLHLTEELNTSDSIADRALMAQNLQRMGKLQRHLTDIISNTLDLNQIKAGKLMMRAEQFDWTDLVENAAETYRAACEEKGLLLVCNIDPGICGKHIESDSLRIRQILFNLIGNAVKYTEQGRVCVAAVLRCKPNAESTLRLEVLDTGTGIPEARQRDVFVEFAQLHDGLEYRARGTGLGLSLVRELAQGLGGQCGFASAEGVGSQFWVELPVKAVTPAATAASGAALTPAAGSGAGGNNEANALKGLRVLVVDDENINRQVICNILERRGVETIQASNGREALDLAAGLPQPVDIILMDIQMPVMDGLQALPKIRALPGWGRVAAICISGAIVESDANDPLQHGFDEMLAKPIAPSNLLAKAGYYSLLNKMAA